MQIVRDGIIKQIQEQAAEIKGVHLLCRPHHIDEGLLLKLDVVGNAEPRHTFQDLLRLEQPGADGGQPAAQQDVEGISRLPNTDACLFNFLLASFERDAVQ